MELLKDTTSGTALGLIQDLDITVANYKKAWEILSYNYGNSEENRAQIIDKVFNTSFVSTNIESLVESFIKYRALIEKLKVNYKIDLLNESANMHLLMAHMTMKKFSSQVQNMFYLVTNENYPTFKQIEEKLNILCIRLMKTQVSKKDDKTVCFSTQFNYNQDDE